MVLRIFLSVLFLVTILLGPVESASSATVAGVFKYRVTNPSCPIKQKTEDGWIAYRGQIEKGSLAIGKPNSKNPDVIVFKTAKTRRLLLASKKSCLFKDTEGTKGSEGAFSLDEKTRIMFSTGLFSWQENINIKLDSATSPLRASSISAVLGLSYLRATETHEWGGTFHILYAKSMVRNARQDPTDIAYAASNVDQAGAIITPQFFWRPHSGSVAFGLSVPVLMRYGAFPLYEGDASKIGPRFRILSGPHLESRFERGGLFFAQRVGFLNVPKYLSWSLETGWRF